MNFKSPEPDIKELRIDLRLFYGYTAKQVRKMKDSEVLAAYRKAVEHVRIEGCNQSKNTLGLMGWDKIDLSKNRFQ
jgi:hypothetical protein